MRLKKISLRKRDGCEMPGISHRRLYLAKTSFGWVVGRFSKEWYGWNLVEPLGVTCGHQLDDITELYQLVMR